MYHSGPVRRTGFIAALPSLRPGAAFSLIRHIPMLMHCIRNIPATTDGAIRHITLVHHRMAPLITSHITA